jgi:hypothetical protein
MMNRQQRHALERQAAKMDRRILGPGGVPVIGGAQQPQSPFIDIRQGDESGPLYRLPVVAVGFIPPDQIEALAKAVASFILQASAEAVSSSEAVVKSEA